MFKFDPTFSFRKMGMKMAKFFKWILEVLRFMCFNYILPMFVFYLVYLFSRNSKISIVFFSITLFIGLVMNFKKTKE